MKTHRLCVCIFLSQSLSAQDITLSTAFESALQKNENIPIQENATEQARETVSSARGNLLPTIQGVYTYLRQDVPTASGTSFGFPKEQNSARITLTQPIFQGTKEYAALRSAKEAVITNELLEKQTRIALFQAVALAYYSVIAAEEDLANLEASLKINRERLKDLQAWFKIGRTRSGDLLLEKSQIASLLAVIEGDRTAISQARYQFSFLTGLDKSVPLKKDGVNLPKNLPDLSTFLNSIEERPDIGVLRSQIKIAEENVAIQKGGHYPTLEAFGNYYILRDGGLKDSKWDVGLTFTLPLYGGGNTNTQVRIASLKLNQLRLQVNQTIRSTENAIRSLYDSVLSGLKQIQSNQEAVRISEENYKTQVKDFRHGLVTNLDVITALSTLEDARRVADRVVYQTLNSYIQLYSSSGKIPSFY